MKTSFHELQTTIFYTFISIRNKFIHFSTKKITFFLLHKSFQHRIRKRNNKVSQTNREKSEKRDNNVSFMIHVQFIIEIIEP